MNHLFNYAGIILPLLILAWILFFSFAGTWTKFLALVAIGLAYGAEYWIELSMDEMYRPAFWMGTRLVVAFAFLGWVKIKSAAY